MEEIYAFPARVTERWEIGQVQIVPEDPADYMGYRGRPAFPATRIGIRRGSS